MFLGKVISLFLLSGWMLYGQHSPDKGFGRFGQLNDDGLLAVNITPEYFTTPTSRTFVKVQWADDTAKDTVSAISNTGKTISLTDGGAGAPSKVFYTLLYPGIKAEFGASMKIQFSGTSGSTKIKFSALQNPAGITDGNFNYIVITPTNRSCIPLVIAFKSGMDITGWTFTETTDYTEFNFSSAANIGEVRIITPYGVSSVSSSMSAAQKTELYTAAKTWANRLIPIPDSSSYLYSADKTKITITDKYTTQTGEMIAPIPPVLGFAYQKGYPVEFSGEPEFEKCLTQQGQFAFISGNSLTYTLPVPPVDERGYIKPENASTSRINQLNALVDHLGGSWAGNAVDLSYAGMTNAQMAMVYLSAGNLSAVNNAWSAYLPQGFKMPPYSPSAAKKPWNTKTEPFSNLEFIWTYDIECWGTTQQCDLDWGNSLPLYGLYKYAQYKGDWDLVRTNWNAAKRIHKYFDYGDDWAWMTVVNSDHGYSTGTGDPLAATYCGTIACLKMARVLGDTLAEEKFAYKAARICVPAVARFWYTKWARDNGFIGSTGVALGFDEKQGFTRSALGTQDPWYATTILSGDGILHELFLAFLAYNKQGLQDYENEYAQYFPDWADGSYTYSFSTAYQGNSIYVTYPHIFSRAMLGETETALWGYVDTAIINDYVGWVGPNVMAEILSMPSPMTLTEWQPAKYKTGISSADGKTVTLDFEILQAKTWTLEAEVKSGKTPLKATVKGIEYPFEFKNNKLKINAALPAGSFQVKVFF